MKTLFLSGFCLIIILSMLTTSIGDIDVNTIEIAKPPISFIPPLQKESSWVFSGSFIDDRVQFQFKKLKSQVEQAAKISFISSQRPGWIAGLISENTVVTPLGFYSGFHPVKPDDDRLVPRVNAIQISLNSLESIESLFSSFDVVDLSGTIPNNDFYQLFQNLASSGTLVLPFNGVDLGKIERLPQRLEKLVIYNSRITRHLRRLLQYSPRLTNLVFYGCFADSSILNADRHIPGASRYDQFLDPVAPRIQRLTVLYGSSDLMNALAIHPWQALQELTVSHLAPFERLWSRKTGRKVPDYDYTSLSSVIIYIDAEDYQSEEEVMRAVRFSTESAVSLFEEKRDGTVLVQLIRK